MDIENLVLQSKKGDIKSFMELLKHKESLLYKISYTYTNHSYDAEDCLSEASIKAFDKISQLQNSTSFYSWFISILINTCRQLHRKKRNFKKTATADINEIKAVFPITRVEDKMLVEEILSSIENEERELLILKYLEEFTLKEIAEIMKKPESTIKTKIYRALKVIRNKYRGVGHEL